MLELSGAQPVELGLSGLSCACCGYGFSHFQVSGLSDVSNCPGCDDEIDIARLKLAPTAVGLRMLDDAQVVGTRWFHLTHRKHWHDVVLGAEVPVHIGSELAALTRANGIVKRGERWWLHELQLAKNVTISRSVEEDSTDGDMVLSLAEFEERYGEVDAVRYLNVYEDPGNISLAIDPAFVQVVNSITIDAQGIPGHLRRAVVEREAQDAQLAL